MSESNRMTIEEVKAKCSRSADYPITQFLINPISNRIAWLLQDSRITPNQVTLISLSLGLLAGACFFLGSHVWLILGAFLVFASHVLDCVDGDLARVKETSSPFGAVLDPICDRVIELSLFLGAAVGLTRQTFEPMYLIWGFYSFGAVLIYYYIVDAWYRRNLEDDRGRDFLLTVKSRVKLGMYEVILYGFVLAALFNRIDYMLYFAALIGTAGSLFQVFRLKKMLD